MQPSAPRALLLTLSALAVALPWGRPRAADAPLPAPLAAAEAVEPGGVRVTLSPSVEAIVDPASSFRVVLPGRSEDARLSLLDAADALVPATGAREVGEQTVLTVTPRAPLSPAARYLLRVDGVRTRDLHDAAGRAAAPVELPMVVAGSAPEPAKKPARRKRR